jgi:uncharacterized protein YcfL
LNYFIFINSCFMKKLLTLGLALSAVLLAGCGSSQPTTDEAVAPVAPVAPVAEEATGIVATGTETPVVEATPATAVAATGAEAATGN